MSAETELQTTAQSYGRNRGDGRDWERGEVAECASKFSQEFIRPFLQI